MFYKKNDQKKQSNNTLKLDLVIANKGNDGIVTEIVDVIKSTPFNKISFPINTYKRYIFANIDKEDTKVIPIGYIKGFNLDDCTFTVVIFNAYKDRISGINNAKINIEYTMYPEKNNAPESLKVITKMVLIDFDEVKNDIFLEKEESTNE